MSRKVKVTAMDGAYAFEGVSYGPFRASKAQPFVEVPAVLAAALNLPLHESEAQVQASDQAKAEEGGNVGELVQSNHDLKTDLERVTKERDALQSKFDQVVQSAKADLDAAKAQWAKERDGLLTDLADSLKREDALKAQLAQGSNAPAPDQPASAPTSPTDGTPLVEGLPHTDLLTAGGFDTMEKLGAGLVIADGETESPVQKLEGIGKKTVVAYANAVADWKAKQA